VAAVAAAPAPDTGPELGLGLAAADPETAAAMVQGREKAAVVAAKERVESVQGRA
jgi:hypothetical protein